jgi:ADP-ribose pyrophosphatase YjhB (NUDIX family)
MSELPSLPLAVNVAVMDGGDRVLLTRREDFEVWCLPGGAFDHGESLAQAAAREVVEETGLVVRLTRLIGVYSFPNLGDYHTLALFGAVVSGGTLRPDPREVVEARWFSTTGLPDDLLWGQRERLTDVFAGYGGSIVRATDRERPQVWPLNRREHYALRDDSGLDRSEFYSQLATALGDTASPIEVDGIPSARKQASQLG